MNVVSWVGGGYLPADLRGQTSNVAVHIVDWYSTFCKLAGVDPSDSSPVPPLPVDPSLPPSLPPPKDIYGAHAWPDVDGVDLWPILTDPKRRSDPAAAHRSLTLSREVLLVNVTMKLVVAQPNPAILAMLGSMPYVVGWRLRNHT